MLRIRPAKTGDADAIWRILEPIAQAGEVFTLPREIDRESRLRYWFSPEHEVFVAEEEGESWVDEA